MTALWRLIALTVLVVTTASPAPAHFDSPITVISAPAPVAGAGLPFLLLAGGYILVRRYRRRKPDESIFRRSGSGSPSKNAAKQRTELIQHKWNQL